MVSEADHPGSQAYDRWFLLGEKRNELLTLREVEQYGRDNFGDPDYVSIYGLAPREWYARGVRILGRTAVECTRDRLADQIGRDVAAVAGSASSAVVDLFAGSANTLHWIAGHAGARRAIGFELDDAVFRLTRANLSTMGLDIDLRHDGYDHGIRAIGDPDADLLIVFVAPPWGRALDPESGLDLRRTQPPVTDVVDVTTSALGQHKLLIAIQIHETVEPSSLAELTVRFPWFATMIYDLNIPGQNAGLLLATHGWTPA
jgi:16S rRNA G966 N2-methylase RsmD